MSDLKKKVYLAGPHERAIDPKTWREKTENITSRYEFFNPSKLDWVKGENDEEMIQECKTQLRSSDGVILRFMSHQETCGSWHEQQIAWQAEIPVVLVTDISEDEIYTFAKYHSDEMVRTLVQAVNEIGELM